MGLSSIVFIGAGEVGNATLKRLLKNDLPVTGVVTEYADKDHCSKTAENAGIDQILMDEPAHGQTHRLSKQESRTLLSFIKDKRPDLVAVCVWESMLPNKIVDEGNVYNFHASPLPKYRGWGPVNWQIINGEEELGLSIAKMSREYDRGPVVMKDSIPIPPNATADDMYLALETEAPRMFLDLIQRISKGKRVREEKQPQRPVYPDAPMPTERNTAINWGTRVQETYNLIRGWNPMAYAFTYAGNTKLLVERAEIANQKRRNKSPGQILSYSPEGFEVACGQGSLLVTRVLNKNEERIKKSKLKKICKEGLVLIS